MRRHDLVSAAVAAEVDQEAVSEAFAFDHLGAEVADGTRRRERNAPWISDDGPPTVRVRPRLRLADAPSDTAPEQSSIPADPPGRRDLAGFSTWSRRYTVRLMLLDALVGMLAVVGAAAFFPHIISFSTPKLLTHRIRRRHRLAARHRDQPRIRARQHRRRRRRDARGDAGRSCSPSRPEPFRLPSLIGHGVVAVCVMATPMAGAMSLLVRFGPAVTCTGSIGWAGTSAG